MLIKKVNARMQLLRKVWGLGASLQEMVKLWTVYCRPILEQSCVLWSSSLTQENQEDLERTQRSFCKLITNYKFSSYEEMLTKLNLTKLSERWKYLNWKFAKDGLYSDKLTDLFPLHTKNHIMTTRNKEKYFIPTTNTARLRNSSIVQPKL